MAEAHVQVESQLCDIGLDNTGNIYCNLSTPALYEHALKRGEGILAHLGPLVVRTGYYTARAANDKFIVREKTSEDKVWWGKVNKAFDENDFESLRRKILAYIQGRDLYVQDVYAGADKNYRMAVRVITQDAWHNLFVRNMFIRLNDDEKENFKPEFTILHVPHLHANPQYDNTNSEAFIILHLGQKLVLIGGSHYAGEIKKSVFTALNFILPQADVLSMHCSANIGKDGDSALFFGLSGTGKTTLSTDPERRLIGDDEHGWSDDGVFNFEGGCYAKVIGLSAESEPDIHQTTRKFGTILENVALDFDTRRVDLDSDELTENTRASYPITHIESAVRDGMGGHPENIFFLTTDAFGIMPPIARLTPEQAMYHFISGYTSKIGGTEKGLGKEPKATFSACFGAPFMVLHPYEYATLLAKKIEKHNAKIWLVNTGWTGGPYGVGERMKIKHSRAVLKAALSGELDSAEYQKDPVFGFEVPKECSGVPSEILDPKQTWDNPDDYDKKAKDLAERFIKNFKEYADEVPAEVEKEGPNI
ncbi:MAG: phosphoenolpyruvate carboxykinase (ATP) [candidate division Zixibacteria bacterium]|nr:phosphoenolpyruvate carboxykinase (ATP) [candidate division Zixibacteria bacterium]NIR66835.1 phosphoenolpyruvate carboxykinase (ATP) [candidate division Zixibacteria bacterium]NIS15214.1 phosphoenolpyruvate carboxykinase (ATP) [candidate division Zixibacteria bacterium]NIS48334.1 phosphoenolpyruvate carboxykinase (ATP) [candidate division Zixibacteria bacterium]NIT51728.1 phosphoenolpyruvate carboxykinase (ATP) [candidate division Zixibacteria bacterium]